MNQWNTNSREAALSHWELTQKLMQVRAASHIAHITPSTVYSLPWIFQTVWTNSLFHWTCAPWIIVIPNTTLVPVPMADMQLRWPEWPWAQGKGPAESCWEDQRLFCFTCVNTSNWRIASSKQFASLVRKEAWDWTTLVGSPPPWLQHKSLRPV